MLSFDFTRLLISGLLLVAYLKIICWSEMPYNIIPQNIRAVFNYKVRTTFTWIMEKHKGSRENLGDSLSVIYIILPFSCAIIHLSTSKLRLLMKAEEPHMPP